MARMPARTVASASSLRLAPSRGVTLIEVTIAMGVLAVLTALAVPSFQALSKRSRVDAALHLLTSHFASARIAAITSGSPQFFHFSKSHRRGSDQAKRHSCANFARYTKARSKSTGKSHRYL